RGAYWNSLPVLIAGSALTAKPSLYGYNAGITVSETIDPRLRVFAGYEYSAMRFKLEGIHDMIEGDSGSSSTDLSDSFSLANTVPDAFNVGKTEHYIIIGSELLRTPTKRLAAHIGYGVTSNRFVLRLMWESKWINSGLAFYPDGTLIFSPLMNFQVRF
ncbi:MAG: hypothetical protein AAB368_00240, partial [bacterium]